MSEGVADAGAALAVVFAEPGAEVVLSLLAGGTVFISTVNEAEVLTKLVETGYTPAEAVARFVALGFVSVAFDSLFAEAVAALRPVTRSFGLSLGDRACLALAERLALPVLTADRVWAELRLPVTVTLIR